MIDEILIREIHRHVGEGLSQRVYEDEEAGRAPMDTSTRRQFAAHLIGLQLAEHAQVRIQDGRGPFSHAEEAELERAVLNRLFGLGKLQELIDNPEIQDITINGADTVWVIRRDGTKEQHPPVFASDAELVSMIQAEARRGQSEKKWDYASPWVDLRLPSGDRLHAMGWVTGSKPAISIRRHNFDIYSLKQLVPHTLSESLHEFLAASVKAKLNILVAGGTGSGKAQPLDEPIPTPDGWTTMGEIRMGDEILGSDGTPIKVIGLSEIREEKVCTVTFDDGRNVRCSPDHLWEVSSAYSRKRQAPLEQRLLRKRTIIESGTIDRVRARILETPPDLYSSIAQIAKMLWVSETPLRRIAPKSLAAQVEVDGESGSRAKVTAYPVREVMFRYLDDLESGRSDATPLTTVVTTEDLASNVRAHQERANWAIEKVPALNLRDIPLLVDPWLLGAWLGDGTTAAGQLTVGDEDLAATLAEIHKVWPNAHADQDRRPDITTWRVTLPRPRPNLCPRGHEDAEVVRHGKAQSPRCAECERLRQRKNCRAEYETTRTNVSFHEQLAALGVLGAKHIPTDYMRSSDDQRLALLQGLMDTDGTIDKDGRCELALSDERLATDALALIRTLGIKAHMTTASSSYTSLDGARVECSDRYRISFTTDRQVFRLPRKAQRLVTEVRATQERAYIVDVDISDQTVPMRCLYVDSPDHLYLTGDYVPTHNTTTLRCLLNECDPEERLVTVEDSLELSLSRFEGMHLDLIETEARSMNTEGVGAVSMADLVRNSLRMKPDRVIVGEIRGDEVVPMLLAMSQGNEGSMSTIHADSSSSVLPRLALYMSMAPERFGPDTTALMVANALHLVVHIDQLRNGARVVTSIREVVGASDDGRSVATNEIYRPGLDGRARPTPGISDKLLDKLENDGGFDRQWLQPAQGEWESTG